MTTDIEEAMVDSIIDEYRDAAVLLKEKYDEEFNNLVKSVYLITENKGLATEGTEDYIYDSLYIG